jgi:nickel-dependent lactate racemase
MTYYQLPYGKTFQSLELPQQFQADWIEPPFVAGEEHPLPLIETALDSPLNSCRLEEMLSGVKTVAIAINDKTRPVPHQHILPPLLNRLRSISPQNIHFWIATGTHLPMPPEEFSLILPSDIFNKYSVSSHNIEDKNNFIYLGTTQRGTPIWVNRSFYQADLKIVIGNIEPHHFAGFSGGYKTAAIGLTGRETINHNHAMLLDPNARIGEFDKNPLRQDIEEIGQHIKVHFALNVLLNGKKQIVRAFAGTPEAVLQAGIPVARAISETPVHHRYDLVIASCGGHPKDINLYQAQKALTHASMLTRDEGVVILVAACPEGSGSMAYQRFMEQIVSFDQVFLKFKEQGFHVGPHKALQIARDAQRIHIILVSEMASELVSKLLLTPAQTLQAAFALACQWLPDSPQIAFLPRATNTIPSF